MNKQTPGSTFYEHILGCYNMIVWTLVMVEREDVAFRTTQVYVFPTMQDAIEFLQQMMKESHPELDTSDWTMHNYPAKCVSLLAYCHIESHVLPDMTPQLARS